MSQVIVKCYGDLPSREVLFSEIRKNKIGPLSLITIPTAMVHESTSRSYFEVLYDADATYASARDVGSIIVRCCGLVDIAYIKLK